MHDLDPYAKQAADKIVQEAQRRRAEKGKPFLIAIDGGSGSGKSTVASAVAEKLGAVLVPADDFFAAHITDEAWAQRDVKARAADSIDWKRLRHEAIEPLLAGKRARWHSFDFVSGARSDGTYCMLAEFEERSPANVIVLDGAYSARPELTDLIDLSVLVDVPVALRHERLSAREDRARLDSWHARWDGAEDYYFTQVRPVSSFDLVVTNGPPHEGWRWRIGWSGGSSILANKPQGINHLHRANSRNNGKLLCQAPKSQPKTHNHLKPNHLTPKNKPVQTGNLVTPSSIK